MQYRIRNGDRLITTIGSGNLYTGTANFSGSWFNKGNPWIRGTNWLDPNGNAVLLQRDHAWNGLGQTIPVSVGTYTFSCWAYFELAEGQTANFYMGDTQYSGTCEVHIQNIRYTQADAGKWIRVKFTVDITKAGNLAIRPELNEGPGNIYLGSYCLQKGIADGQWSPNPADYGITDRNNAYRITGLAPSTTYQLSVAPFNGLREGPRESITVRTRGLRVIVPVSLNPGAAVTLHYQEYSIGLVPLGTEPTGMFGGGNRQDVPAKVISSSDGSSVLEITSNFNLMNDNMTMNKIADKSFAAFQGYKALYFNEG